MNYLRRIYLRMIYWLSLYFLLLASSPTPIAQSQTTITDGKLPKQDCWRWDRKSQALLYGCGREPVSPAGGSPNFGGSYNYILYYVPEGYRYVGRGQECWKWDRRSQALLYGCSQGAVSPAGGSPNFSGSYNYVLYYNENQGASAVSRGQDCWRWDSKSQALLYGCGREPVSPAGGSPKFGRSFNYILEYSER